ncbi:MAG TPA: DNA mismatch repair protein MutS [Bacteroidota bacterium]|nr:DNA mismatch repair protein MutS [Bacteroidota bacterium]
MSTPLMKQYAQVKARYPGTILLFRMGDFYETFDEDAKTTARVLSIVLTKRGNGAAGEIPLAGFPYHALDSYLPKLLRAGHRVAICEQLEDPKVAKGIVKRDVIEVVTPGVLFSDKILQQKQNNFLASLSLPSALATGADVVGFAFVDVSTGEFGVSEFPLRELRERIGALNVSELLVQKRDAEGITKLLADAYRGLITRVEDWVFNDEYGFELLVRHFNTQSLKGFGIEEMPRGIVAAGAVVNYLQETQKSNLLHIRKIVPVVHGESILLDRSTKRNLEISSTLAGEVDGSLFSVLDRTVTPMGGRLLKAWVNNPLRRQDAIEERLDAVDALFKDRSVRRRLRDALRPIGDLERLTAKVATGRCIPRELVHLSSTLESIPPLKETVEAVRFESLQAFVQGLDALAEVSTRIRTAMNNDPPATLREGAVIRKGYNAELDEIRAAAFGAKDWIAQLQKRERERTGISSLKIGFTGVFGYYIEITNTHKDKVPPDYIRKQTLTNAERYVTPALQEYEEKILRADERILALETQLFNDLREHVAQHALAIQQNAHILATLDCFAALADVAAEYGYVKPAIEDSDALEIVGGRHPVLERLLPPGEQYTPNDVRLNSDAEQIMIITGPNMSGKSSYLRQTGLIVLLAHVGSFVPASSARIGLVDRIFTRVGANDNIAAGESTFLVEMHEAANIVNTATRRSLILLDEVGRGTSTFDGISIAWALTEFLHQRIGAKTLFATHYHELNQLADILPRVRNFKVDVREYGDKVIFLHKVVPGFADHSYGIQVAQMAGLPDELTARAKEILKNLEGSGILVHGDPSQSPSGSGDASVQLTIFEPQDDAMKQELKNIDPEKITPLDALQILTALRKKYIAQEDTRRTK